MTTFHTEFTPGILLAIENQSNVKWRTGDNPTEWVPFRGTVLVIGVNEPDTLTFGRPFHPSEELTTEEFINKCAELAPKQETKDGN